MSEFVKTRVKIRADHLAGLVHVHRNQHVGAVIHRQIFTVELIHDHDLVLAVIPGQTTKNPHRTFYRWTQTHILCHLRHCKQTKYIDCEVI